MNLKNIHFKFKLKSSRGIPTYLTAVERLDMWVNGDWCPQWLYYLWKWYIPALIQHLKSIKTHSNIPTFIWIEYFKVPILCRMPLNHAIALGYLIWTWVPEAIYSSEPRYMAAIAIETFMVNQFLLKNWGKC